MSANQRDCKQLVGCAVFIEQFFIILTFSDFDMFFVPQQCSISRKQAWYKKKPDMTFLTKVMTVERSPHFSNQTPSYVVSLESLWSKEHCGTILKFL